ncbi:FAD-dependent oxidoreductase [candidate division KSB1 bacterium]|nr:FAD-dependent oxidoreductase [candidate division KSB1 bacterium]
MRIESHPILTFRRGREIQFTFDGIPIKAFDGETIAAALHATGIRVLSKSLRRHRPRGFFCAIGKCSSCLMEVNGVPNIKSCMVMARDGMVVKSQTGWGKLPASTSTTQFIRKDFPLYQTEIAIIGGGPAGLSAAIYAAKLGAKVMIFDENAVIGGQLIKQTHMFFGSRDHYAKIRGIDISNKLIEQLQGLDVQIFTDTSVIGYFHPHTLAIIHQGRLKQVRARKVIVATGAAENMLAFENNDLPGVYGAGAVQTLMNVYGILPGETILMVGAGNIGVIVSYQLLQAGAKVAAVIEALPSIGAYQVHASKIARTGVPILTSHTIQAAIGNDRVEAARIVRIDRNWKEIPGSERELAVDTICLSVGLNPTSEILSQAGCEMRYIAPLGGNVALHDENLETSVPGLYVAGDVSGIEEASSAMLEGRLCGIGAVEKLTGTTEEIRRLKADVIKGLQELRSGPFGEKTRTGEHQLAKEWHKR